jgi:hypothetical protein
MGISPRGQALMLREEMAASVMLPRDMRMNWVVNEPQNF